MLYDVVLVCIFLYLQKSILQTAYYSYNLNLKKICRDLMENKLSSLNGISKNCKNNLNFQAQIASHLFPMIDNSQITAKEFSSDFQKKI